MSSHSGAFYGIESLMDYFRLERRSFPREVTTLEEAVDLLNDETELILIPTDLEGDWYCTAPGPLLVQDEEGMDLAILPDWRGRCYFRDRGTGRRVYLTARDSRRFPRAYCVVRDFPGAQVTAPGVLSRMFRCLSWYEGALLLAWSLLGGGLWVLLAQQVYGTLSTVMLTADVAAALSGAGAMLCECALIMVLLLSGRQVVRRVSQKGALAVLLGIGGRLYAAEDADDGAAAALAALRDNGERMMSWLMTALWGLPAVLVILPVLLNRAPRVFPVAAAAVPVLYAAAAAVFRISAGKKRDPEAARYWEWLLHREADRRLGVERPFPGGRDRRRPVRPGGAAWPLGALLVLPVLYVAVAGDFSTARLMQTVLLYLAAVVMPLKVLLRAPEAGRAMAEISPLLPLARRERGIWMPLPPKGSVFELKDVTFSYPGRTEPVLRGVNLRLHPGETVGILGATGAGKTTLARLMTGLAQPTGGNIYYGGIELTRYNGRTLRHRIACERGTDILLCRALPEDRAGRTCVVFSARAEMLEGCDRILRLADGVLTQE